MNQHEQLRGWITGGGPLESPVGLVEEWDAAQERIRELEKERDHCLYWYATRHARLDQWAREELTEEQRHCYFSIVANGIPDPMEPPTYAQQFNALKYRAEKAEAVQERILELEAALRFYADPETYIAIGFFPDPPNGPFMDDFEETPDLGWKPGKCARAALAKAEKP